jgi:hypothetical protein
MLDRFHSGGENSVRMAAFKFTMTRAVPFRVILKASLLAGVIVIIPLYTFLAWAEFGYPARGAAKGLLLFLFLALGGWILWRFLRTTGFRRGGPGSGPDGPKVREPRPPGGRPPALATTARTDKD